MSESDLCCCYYISPPILVNCNASHVQIDISFFISRCGLYIWYAPSVSIDCNFCISCCYLCWCFQFLWARYLMTLVFISCVSFVSWVSSRQLNSKKMKTEFTAQICWFVCRGVMSQVLPYWIQWPRHVQNKFVSSTRQFRQPTTTTQMLCAYHSIPLLFHFLILN